MRPMRTWLRLAPALLLAATCHAAETPSPPAATASAAQLAGLWQARRTFGPLIGGTLRITRSEAGWMGEIAGRSVPVRIEGDDVRFELPDGEGAFLGERAKDGARITGHWIQPGNDGGGPFASPVDLSKAAQDDWRGAIVPLG